MRGDRHSRRRARAHRRGLRRAQSRHRRKCGLRETLAGSRQGDHRALQISARGDVRRCAAEDGDRQDPALPPAAEVGRRMTDFQFLQPKGWNASKGYANGVAADGRLVFVAGQIGWTEDAQLVSDDFVAQAERALMNVVAVLTEAGGEPRHIVRMTWFVTGKA